MEMLGIALAQNGYKIFILRIPPLKRLDITEINVEWFVHFYIWLLDVYNLDSEDNWDLYSTSNVKIENGVATIGYYNNDIHDSK